MHSCLQACILAKQSLCRRLIAILLSQVALDPRAKLDGLSPTPLELPEDLLGEGSGLTPGEDRLQPLLEVLAGLLAQHRDMPDAVEEAIPTARSRGRGRSALGPRYTLGRQAARRRSGLLLSKVSASVLLVPQKTYKRQDITYMQRIRPAEGGAHGGW